MNLSPEDIEELSALKKMNDITGGPSFLMRSHWKDRYGRLVRWGLVIWGDPPEGFDRRKFAGTTITEAGREAVRMASQ